MSQSAETQSWIWKRKGFEEVRIIFFSDACSVQFSHSVMSNSLQPHGLQHTRLPCPSPTPRAYSNSCPSRRWYHPTISSSVIPFSCLQSFPASVSFPLSWLFASGGQSIGALTSASDLSMNIQLIFLKIIWFDLLTGTLKSLLQHHSTKASVLWCSAFFMAPLSQLYMTTGKTRVLIIQTFFWQSDVFAF